MFISPFSLMSIWHLSVCHSKVFCLFPKGSCVYVTCSATDYVHKAAWKSGNTHVYTQTLYVHAHSCKKHLYVTQMPHRYRWIFYINSPQPFFPLLSPHLTPSSPRPSFCLSPHLLNLRRVPPDSLFPVNMCLLRPPMHWSPFSNFT